MQTQDLNVATTEASRFGSVKPRSPSSKREPAARARPAAPRRSSPTGSRLNPAMPCEIAFRIVARRHLSRLTASHAATCESDEDALHQMRVALTHLRTCILFFSPMVKDADRAGIRGELKWLNRQLGLVRDLDVAIGRIEATSPTKELPRFAAWQDKRTQGHLALARALQSTRYRRLIVATSEWIESGSWSTRADENAARARTVPILVYALHKLSRWERRLLRKSRKLCSLDVEKRHRLRLLNKKLNYAIESCQDLFADERFSKQEAALKHLRKAQRYLGQLNDDAREQTLARELRRDGAKALVPRPHPGREKLLLEKTATAYAKLAKLKPFRS
jgi:CHAD domain-containing protein